MKTVNATFSLPENVNIQLHAMVEKRGLSRFVAKAIEEALEKKQKNLKAAYSAAESDADRKETLGDWAELDGEDWNDQ